ncbi:Tim17/Tim22/Tim23/Pmp24 family-domain-containing protein [Pyronema domesticum]|uniref:Similar to Peroxisomal membrane protein 4 acc. no. P59382 n=1 Tax=Pyronema omphalodes (strain CBS 100304) TaxID=1076935 RepID=U4L3Q1_PYROM|nr:Tim17/Tim22/Tim23/Pmp24 family-domain-containing protein [Pyronema domesticum]CCX10208.1 Similar to Peroxisomal membrane protein 4; acc. no. P59382 [Pyronema omphalodes CBS 100304]
MATHLAALESAVNTFLLDPVNHDILVLLKGLRNGLVYGTKIRFPHALVMVLLFRSGTFREKFSTILTLTKNHAKTLGSFVLTYKSAMLFLRHLTGGKEEGHHSFLAGLLGGYLVFGRGKQTSVNQQIVMYVFARVVMGMAKLSVKKGIVPDPNGVVSNNAHPVFAAMSWACVMWLFRWHPDVVQSSLRTSMVYLYNNAETWDGWKNFLWHNS